ncbi:MAG: DUF4143 domain-containing protein [Streptococcaceae bacterium]|jgi:predicted AAA+ superfamily ATPase|nr:DUF4143 domain-containing protein [Streptococcaceae bacterium]
MIKNIQESLAGRIGILQLYSLSMNELADIHFENELTYSLASFKQRQKLAKPNNILDVFNYIWRGGMPEIQTVDEEVRADYFDAYINTYLMRDAFELGGITNSLKFGKLLTACAALVSEQVSYKNLADAADISQPTAKEWLRLLESLGVTYLLKPYANNELKRLNKTPKLYFCDTGLCAHLSMWLTPDILRTGAKNGSYFENFVVMQLVRAYSYGKTKANLTYYRDANKKEIDLLVEEGQFIHPFEIKLSANPKRQEVRKFNVFDKANIKQGDSGISV